MNSRQARDDFIEDDDGSGYVDNGVDEWETNGRGDDNECRSDLRIELYERPPRLHVLEIGIVRTP